MDKQTADFVRRHLTMLLMIRKMYTRLPYIKIVSDPIHLV